MTRIDPSPRTIMEPLIAKLISAGLKELLETKHLYQNYCFPIPIFDEILLKVPKHFNLDKSQIQDCQKLCTSIGQVEWRIYNQDKASSFYSVLGMIQNSLIPIIEFLPSTIIIFCPYCDRSQPFNFLYGFDIYQEFKSDIAVETPIELQNFLLCFECQGCKKSPDIFLVHREKLKLIVSGRTPMEEIEILNYFPKEHRKYFSDAINAFNSGQVLAGKFLLRTFIEQYIRDLTNEHETQNIELLFDKYAENLISSFKESFPSLKTFIIN
jgi:hypothetical protein